MTIGRLTLGSVLVSTLTLLGCSGGSGATRPDARPAPSSSTTTTTAVVAGSSTPTTAGAAALQLDPSLASVPHRVYVPNGKSNSVSIIDPDTRSVIRTFRTSKEPQHIVPAFDLHTLWVLDNAGNDVIPIDPTTSEPGTPIPVRDPYNLYFTPTGSDAIVVAEAEKRLDLRDPHTMALRRSIPVPDCAGVNHIDYPADYSYLVATCEFGGALAKVDYADGKVESMLKLPADADGTAAMPQDIRIGPDGTTFFVADMTRGGVYVVDGPSFTVLGFVPTGTGAHGITPSRDGRTFYVANRGSRSMSGRRHGPGSLSLFDPSSRTVTATWPLPGGGSPDMGNLSTDGSELWLSGRFDHEVYVFDLVHGGLAARIPVGSGPHGLTYWPQPGRLSLGHTGNMR